MKLQKLLFFALVCVLILSGCIFGNSQGSLSFYEKRIALISTNIIGIVGAHSNTPYIEIIYSVADKENPGYNKTGSRWVSPPYIFQVNFVYMDYEYKEWSDSAGRPFRSDKILLRNFEEGGAEYLTIINHSTDHQVEFFIAGAPSIFGDNDPRPAITYRNIPLYFLLFPERDLENNWGRQWSAEEVAGLYRAELARSDDVQLLVVDGYRMIDLLEGRAPGSGRFQGAIFHGIIEPGDELKADEKIWLLATSSLMFFEEFAGGRLP